MQIPHSTSPTHLLPGHRCMPSPDWIIENSRTAVWGPYRGAPESVVVDPTIMLGLCCFPEFRNGIERIIRHAHVRAPDTIIKDTTSVLVGLREMKKMTTDEVDQVLRFMDAFPVELVRPDYGMICSRFVPEGIPLRAACYLSAARGKPSVLMSFDELLIRQCRIMRIPRCRFTRKHRLSIRSRPSNSS